MKKIIVFIPLFLIGFIVSRAQNTPSSNASEILLSLKKLNTLGSVLYIAAHPDDENTRLLAYLTKERNLRTGYLSLTRGDGGQNLIGKEQGGELGLIRTQELLAARRNDGAEQFFTRANDFGYSKNPDETFSIWNKDSILADVVWVIRRFRPDVIICRFPTTGEGGHGHHTASAILSVEAFDAAADAKRFPEQLIYVQPWQAKRLFWNTFNFGTTNTTAPNQIKIDVGGYNTLLGKGYGEIAAESRSMHKSQGFGTAKARGSMVEYFKQLKGDTLKTDLFEGMDQSWKRLNVGLKIQEKINECIKQLNPIQPEKIIPLLVNVYKQIQQLNGNDSTTNYWKSIKLKETEALIFSCSGLWMEAYSSEYSCIPGNNCTILSQIINRNNTPVKLNKISFMHQTDTITALDLKQNIMYTFLHKEMLPATIPYSNPYWLDKTHDKGLYNVQDQLLIGTPENNSRTKVAFNLNVFDLNFTVERDIVYKYTDPVKGELYRPLEIIPPATVNISDPVFVFADSEAKNIQFTVKANTPDIKGKVQVELSEGWKITIKNPEFSLANKGDETIIDATVIPPANDDKGRLMVSLLINKVNYTKSIKRIEYDHIPYQFILTDAEALLVKVALKKAGITIGYIPGSGDEVPTCLKQIGYNVTLLTDELLTKENFSKFDAIVTGVRAYNTNNRLQVNYSKLMDYVQKGGNLIVQYNTNNRIGPVLAKIGPYPFTISRDRVTNETAEVRFTNPKHSVLKYPNLITEKDFEGWVQERGIYFATELDKNYETIFSMNDPNEKASEGSLIVAKYGKGNFAYTGLAFFRELPAGIPGAYRLFANLISLPSTK
ncbi:MAG TPA: PIG-L family deacetylase [Cytophagaceae bacterium]|jgi:LmbE family N-acetylglucosaminyl deacetylase|nr:PIG-L family deacetylase [Cytophagaceae bacterium]